MHGSGFLAVYLAGLILGGSQIPAKRTITTFHTGFGWLAQVAMFMTLGLLVFPSELGPSRSRGHGAGARDRPGRAPGRDVRGHGRGRVLDGGASWLLGWAGLRGAVPVVLATFPVIEGVTDSNEFFNIVFFAVLLSTLLQGATFEPLARVLGVTASEAAIPTPFADAGAIRRLGAEVIEYPVRPEDAVVGRDRARAWAAARCPAQPRDPGQQALPPRGSTRIESNDRLHIIVRQEVSVEMGVLMERWRDGPIGVSRRPVRRSGTRQTPFSMRPWGSHPGDAGTPAHPETVQGVDVIDQLRTRRDGRDGAVVLLEDGRYAFTGPIIALGTASQVQMAARRRLRLAKTDSERAWWREAIGSLAAPER